MNPNLIFIFWVPNLSDKSLVAFDVAISTCGAYYTGPYCQFSTMTCIDANQVIIAALYYNEVIMSAMVSQIPGPTIVYSTVYSGVDPRKHQSSASLAFVRGILEWPMNSPHKGPVTRKMFPFDRVIMSPWMSGKWDWEQGHIV